MRNIFFSILILFSLILTGNTFAYDNNFSNIISEEIFSELLLNEQLSNSFTGVGELTLIPNLPFKEVIAGSIEDLEPTITVEVLFLFSKDNTNFESDESHLKIFNSIRAISTLTGIEYYSASRSRMRIFFEDACIIDTPESNIRLPDPTAERIPDYDKQIIYTKDSSLGKLHSDVTYLYYADYFAMMMQNKTKIWQFFIPLVDPGELKTYMLIIPEDDYILFYGISLIKTFGAAESRGRNSLYNRLVAFFNWFKNNFDDTDIEN